MVSRVTEGGFRTSVDHVLRVFSPNRQLSRQQSLANAQLSLTLEGAAVSLQTLCSRFERSDSPLRSLCYRALPVCFVGSGRTSTWEMM